MAGGKSKSSSSNSTSTTQIDKRIGATDNATVLTAEGGSVINFTDGNAMAAANRMLLNSLGYNTAQYGKLLETTDSALDNLGKVLGNGLSYNATNTAKLLEVTKDVAGSAGNMLQTSLSYGAANTSKVLDASEGLVDSASRMLASSLGASTQTYDKALEALTGFGNASLAAVNKASDQAFKFAETIRQEADEKNYKTLVQWAAIVAMVGLVAWGYRRGR